MPYDTAQAAPNLRAVLPSLLLKERIKLLRFGWIPFALVAAALVDFGLTMRTIAKMHGTAASWLGILEKEQILFERLLWAYVASGALWSLLQTVPECIEGRLRIAFHLPIDTRVSIAFPTFVGVALTALLALFGGVGFYLVCCLLGMPHELPALMLPALYPWMLTAPIAWCVVASAAAEPSKLRKLALALVGAAFVAMLSSGRGFAGAGADLPIFCLLALLWLPIPYASALRLKG